MRGNKLMRIPGLAVAVFFIGIDKKVAIARVGRIAHVRPAAGFGKALLKIACRHVRRGRKTRHGGLRHFFQVRGHQTGQIVRRVRSLVFAVIRGDSTAHLYQLVLGAALLRFVHQGEKLRHRKPQKQGKHHHRN